MTGVDAEFLATQSLAQTPPASPEYAGIFGLALLFDGCEVVGVERVESSPVLQVEQVIPVPTRPLGYRHVFGLVEHNGALPAPAQLRCRHAADMLFTTNQTREFAISAIEQFINQKAAV